MARISFLAAILRFIWPALPSPPSCPWSNLPACALRCSPGQPVRAPMGSHSVARSLIDLLPLHQGRLAVAYMECFQSHFSANANCRPITGAVLLWGCPPPPRQSGPFRSWRHGSAGSAPIRRPGPLKLVPHVGRNLR